MGDDTSVRAPDTPARSGAGGGTGGRQRRPLRIGIVGARFAADLHAVNYRPLLGRKATLSAVCSRTAAEAQAFATRHEIPRVFTDYRALVASPDVDVVDVCATTNVHHEIAVAAAQAGKHVIVEKPLTGWFGTAGDPRDQMLAGALQHCDAVLEAVSKAGVTLCYAEDFVYAPPLSKLRRLLDASGGAILELRAEESHSGSHADSARRWQTAGGGSFLRMGSHPVGAVLHLKHYEGRVRGGAPIRARSVIADVAQLTRLPGIMARPRYLRAAPEDVEDWAVAVSAYLTSGVVHANITPNTAVVAYAPEARVWGEEYITEKVETTSGWQFPSPEEDWMRGYPQELEDFVDAIRDGRPPLSDASLAREVVEVIYAGYLSAASGRRVELQRP